MSSTRTPPCALDAVTRTASAFVTDTLDVSSRVHVTAFGARQLDDRPAAQSDRRRVERRPRVRAGQSRPGCHLRRDARGESLRGVGAVVPRADTRRADLRRSGGSLPVAQRLRLGPASISRWRRRGKAARVAGSGRGSWSVALFSTGVADDLIFVSSGRVRGSGHFGNSRADTTAWPRDHRRVAGRPRDAVRAPTRTSRRRTASNLEVLSPAHPEADEGQLQVRAGDALPGVPAHVGRIGLSARVTPAIAVAATWRGQIVAVPTWRRANLLEPVAAFADRWMRRLAGASAVASCWSPRPPTCSMPVTRRSGCWATPACSARPTRTNRGSSARGRHAPPGSA